MNRDKLFPFYEKMYFHEMETREKLFTRVQINFALIFTGFSIVSYMLRMLDFSVYREAAIAFVVLAVLSIALSAIGVWHLISAFWGNEYKGVPSPKETDGYRVEVQQYVVSINQYNEDYPENKQPVVDVDEMVSQFIYEQLRDCSSHNTDINDTRFARIHNSVRWLLIASVPFLLASVLFVTFDLDTSSPRKETLIYNRSLVDKLENIDSNIANAVLHNQNMLEVQQLCLKNQEQVLHHLHQALQQRQNHEELLKTVNHLKKCEDLMTDKKATPPPPPPPPQKPITRSVMDEAPPKKSS
ncbi:hypothetical protein [Vibrio rarus]|uniref:hypothetical protein n=1 Tax=Vibrio rarus TaxID=413403 RepID=UPI0021C375C6|nr:hypothetical protein [Vibrio rarus]